MIINHKKVLRLMRKLQLKAIYPWGKDNKACKRGGDLSQSFKGVRNFQAPSGISNRYYYLPQNFAWVYVFGCID